jgi:hypothetical protein
MAATTDQRPADDQPATDAVRGADHEVTESLEPVACAGSRNLDEEPERGRLSSPFISTVRSSTGPWIRRMPLSRSVIPARAPSLLPVLVPDLLRPPLGTGLVGFFIAANSLCEWVLLRPRCCSTGVSRDAECGCSLALRCSTPSGCGLTSISGPLSWIWWPTPKRSAHTGVPGRPAPVVVPQLVPGRESGRSHFPRGRVHPRRVAFWGRAPVNRLRSTPRLSPRSCG